MVGEQTGNYSIATKGGHPPDPTSFLVVLTMFSSQLISHDRYSSRAIPNGDLATIECIESHSSTL